MTIDRSGDADLQLALALADEADAMSLAKFRSGDLRVETKPDLTPVTEADQAIERHLRERLAGARPGDTVIGEEYGGAAPGQRLTGRTWVIDPIDGTKNYVRGVPVWATLIGLLVDGAPEVGVVSAPALGSRWWAQAGAGAYALGPADAQPRRLSVSAVGRIADSSFSYSDHEGWEQLGASAGFAALLRDCWRTRGYGDFWSHLLVAEGVVDLSAEVGVKLWDVAALAPVITEAGGRVSTLDGGDIVAAGSIVATNGLLHDQVVRVLAAGRGANP